MSPFLDRWLRTGRRPVLARLRRPSPAMIVALIALFASLGGVSYGFATGTIDSREIKNNSVRSSDLRNNEIRTRDLRNNEVRGIDIRNSTVQGRDIALNTVTGTDVNESTLQQVPSAAQADSAANAASVSSLKVISVVTVPEGGQPAVLATHGPFTVRGTCGATGAEVTVSTTENDSSASDGNPPFGPADPPATVASPTSAYSVAPVAALAPSGKGFTGEVALQHDSTHQVCRFHGDLALQG
jgi:hypothetical protein